MKSNCLSKNTNFEQNSVVYVNSNCMNNNSLYENGNIVLEEVYSDLDFMNIIQTRKLNAKVFERQIINKNKVRVRK